MFFLVCESDAECAQWIRHLKSRLPSDAAAALGGGAEPFDPSSRWREGRDPSFKGSGSPARTVYEEVEPQGLRKSIGDNKGIQYQHVQPPNPGGKSPQVAQPECVYSVPVRHKDTHGADGSTRRESDLVYSVVTPAQLRAGAAAPPLPPRAADGTDSVLYSSLAFSDEDDSDDDDTIQAVLGGSLVASGLILSSCVPVHAREFTHALPARNCTARQQAGVSERCPQRQCHGGPAPTTKRSESEWALPWHGMNGVLLS